MRIHFIGIGGIGVSALAKYYLAKKWGVSGCDLVSSEITEQLQKMGAKIRIGPPQESCVPPHTEKIIYSPAVLEDNIELTHAKDVLLQERKGTSFVETLSYPEALGELTKTHYTIAISGTHGKSTTTAMLALILIEAGLDPTVIIGTKLKEFGNSNFMAGKSNYLLIEADEHFASFLNYWPKMIVLTNIDKDHLDYYKTLPNIIKTFKEYIRHVPKNGYLVFNEADANSQKILQSNPRLKPTIVGFNPKQKEAEKLRKILKIPGEHNISNALAALAAAKILKIPASVGLAALSKYRGAWRRFEIFDVKIGNCKLKIVSDYGHHPAKIKATIQGARSKWPHKKIWLVYQPHQYARTYYLFKDFVKVLSGLPIEKLILTDIFDVAGRENEEMRKKVSSEKLAKAIENCKLKIENYPILYIPDSPPFSKIEKYLKENLQGGEIVIVMGAGNIYNLTIRLTQH